MTLVKSFAVGNGDMFYIRHGSDNFTVIDSCLSDDNRDAILRELRAMSRDKGIVRFISTHPDDDHMRGLTELHAAMNLRNFYCVANGATKAEWTEDFGTYCSLRDDSKKAFHLERGCSRKWMNAGSEERGAAGINILWPITTNPHLKDALAAAKRGESPNNLSPVVKYSLNGGVTMIWMGDLESDFMELVEDAIAMDNADILFAPHHGRDSGTVPQKWLLEMDPKVVVIGEAPSEHLNYYAGYNTLKQNGAGTIVFDCEAGETHVYVESPSYTEDFLVDKRLANSDHGHYIGTLPT